MCLEFSKLFVRTSTPGRPNLAEKTINALLFYRTPPNLIFTNFSKMAGKGRGAILNMMWSGRRPAPVQWAWGTPKQWAARWASRVWAELAERTWVSGAGWAELAEHSPRALRFGTLSAWYVRHLSFHPQMRNSHLTQTRAKKCFCVRKMNKTWKKTHKCDVRRGKNCSIY